MKNNIYIVALLFFALLNVNNCTLVNQVKDVYNSATGATSESDKSEESSQDEEAPQNDAISQNNTNSNNTNSSEEQRPPDVRKQEATPSSVAENPGKQVGIQDPAKKSGARSDNPPAASQGNRIVGSKKYYSKDRPKQPRTVQSDGVEIKFESISIINENRFKLVMAIKNLDDIPKSVYLTDIRLINRSKKTLRPEDAGNKWAIPGEHETYAFNGILEGWKNFESGEKYTSVDANGNIGPINVEIEGRPDFNKYAYSLLVICNNNNFLVMDAGMLVN